MQERLQQRNEAKFTRARAWAKARAIVFSERGWSRSCLLIPS